MEKINNSMLEHSRDELSEVEDIARVTTTESAQDGVLKQAVGGQSPEDLPRRYYRSPRFLMSYLSVLLAYASSFGGYVMISTSLTSINEAIGPSDSIIWVVLTYTLTQTIIFTVNGRLSDIFGRRYFFISGSLFAFTGFLVSSRANSVTQIIGASVLSGFGTGMQQCQPIIFGEMIPNKHRYAVLGSLFGGLAPLTAISPGLAGVMIKHASWRWVYYTAAIYAGSSALLQIVFFFPPSFDLLHSKLSKKRAVLGLDYVGLILWAGSAASVVLGFSWAGPEHPWRSASVIAPLVIGFVGLVGFVLWEAYSPVKEPLMPLYLFKSRNFVTLSIISTVGAMIFYASNIVYPQQISVVNREPAQNVGWYVCTIAGGAVLGQLLSIFMVPFLCRVIGFKWQLIICCTIFTAFIGGLAAIDVGSLGRTVAFSLISSMMIGWMEVVTMAGAPLMVEPKDLGIANGVEFSTRGIFCSLAIAIYSTILTNEIPGKLAEYVPPAAISAGLPEASVPALIGYIATGNTTGLESISGITPAIIEAAGGAATTAYIKSYQLVYFASISFGICALIAAFCIDEKKMQEKYTSEVSRKLQHAGNEKASPGDSTESIEQQA